MANQRSQVVMETFRYYYHGSNEPPISILKTQAFVVKTLKRCGFFIFQLYVLCLCRASTISFRHTSPITSSGSIIMWKVWRSWMIKQ